MNYFIREIGYFCYKIEHLCRSKHLKMEHRAKATKRSRFEGYNKLSANSYFDGTLGYASYVGADSSVTGEVGRYCSIAAKVTFLTATHPTKSFVSTHPCFYSMKKQSGFTYVDGQKFDENPKLNDSDYSLKVGNDVYIGYGATIIGPIVIGDGAIIAANATVVDDVEPYSIVGGCPAKKIGMRFDQNTVDYLMKLQWWNKGPQWLKENVDLFEDIDKLREVYNVH